MKIRIISALVALAICIYPLLNGGLSLKILVAFVAIIASHEIVKTVFKEKLSYYVFISLLIYCGLSIADYGHVSIYNMVFLLILFALAVVFADHSLDKIGCCYLVAMIMSFVGQYILKVYSTGQEILILYTLIGAFMENIFAYFGGLTFKKMGWPTHKFNERVSPKKTVEGAVSGWFFSALISFVFAYLNGFFGLNVLTIAFISLFLPLVSQVGDLSFSLIKRYFGVKDFGYIMPGHGGILDRLDAMLFCLAFVGLII